MQLISLTFFTVALASLVSATQQCSSTQFPWTAKTECCLPHGGHPSPPSPPKGSSCPSSWYWHENQNCCVPQHPSEPPTPSCGSGIWSHSDQCCHDHGHSSTPAGPQPTHGWGNHNRRSNAGNHKKNIGAKARIATFDEE